MYKTLRFEQFKIPRCCSSVSNRNLSSNPVINYKIIIVYYHSKCQQCPDTCVTIATTCILLERKKERNHPVTRKYHVQPYRGRKRNVRGSRDSFVAASVSADLAPTSLRDFTAMRDDRDIFSSGRFFFLRFFQRESGDGDELSRQPCKSIASVVGARIDCQRNEKLRGMLFKGWIVGNTPAARVPFQDRSARGH